MDGSPRAINVDALLAQSSWLRRLASHLVVDPDLAEDLVQDTWQRALENPPAPGVDLRSWLARILRHRAIDRGRDADVRRWHERSASREEEWSTAEIEERVGLQRRLAEAVLELDEPYRSAITLTYFEGMSAPEIARRQRATDAAIRQRIARGREMLRARLDKEYDGNRTEWCLLVMTFLRKGGPAPAAALPVGTIVAVAAGLVLVGILVWRQLVPRSARGPASAPALATADAPPKRTGPGGAAGASTPGTREALKAPPAVDPDLELRGVVLDPLGAPVAGAKVEIFADETSGYAWDPEAQSARRREKETRTDALGAFAVELPRGRPFELEASADGYATSTLGYRYAGEQVTVLLALGASWEGRVTKASDGEPVPGARLEISTLAGTLDGMRLDLREGETDRDGRFRFDGLPELPLSLRVAPRDRGMLVTRRVDLASLRTEVSEIRIEEGRTVRGRVLDAETGEPIPFAEVGEMPASRDFARADANGEFEYSCARERRVALLARAPGFASAVRVFNTASNVDDLPDRLDFRLARGWLVLGRVVDAGGLPVVGAHVAAVSDLPIDPSIAEAVRIRGRTDARGRFELPDASRELAFTLLVRSGGSGALVRPCPARDPGTEASFDVGDLVLPPAASFRGSVVDADRLPVPDAVVHLFETEVPALRRKLTERWARADDRGRFTFADLSAGAYEVEVRHPSSNAPISRKVTIPEGENVAGFEVALPVRPSISGRVTDPEGQGVAGMHVRAFSDETHGREEAYAITDSTGTFSVAGLKSKRYRIEVNVASARGFLPGVRTEVPAGAKDLVLGLEAAAVLSGSVVDAGGRAVARGEVIGRVAGRDGVFLALTSADGSFVLAVPVGVSVDLEAWPGRSKDDARVARRPGVVPSDSPLELTIP